MVCANHHITIAYRGGMNCPLCVERKTVERLEMECEGVHEQIDMLRLQLDELVSIAKAAVS